jgi:hypothetical protein
VDYGKAGEPGGDKARLVADGLSIATIRNRSVADALLDVGYNAEKAAMLVDNLRIAADKAIIQQKEKQQQEEEQKKQEEAEQWPPKRKPPLEV